MNPQQRKRIIDSQRDAWLRYGYHPHALYWSDLNIQHLRFAQLQKIGMQSGDSVLDVGCGFGDLAGYLSLQGIKSRYTGIDLSPELLAEGRKRYPESCLLEGDLFDINPEPESFDYVLMSGALNRDLQDKGSYAYKTLRLMFAICRKGMAFNLLDARHEWIKGRWDLQSFLPDEVLRFVKQFTPKPVAVQLVDDYLDNDFTILVWKDRRK